MGCFPGRRSRRRLPIAVRVARSRAAVPRGFPLRRFVEPSWLSLRQRPSRSHPFHLPTTSSGRRRSPASPSCSRARTPRPRSRPGTPRRARSTPRWPSSTRAPRSPSTRLAPPLVAAARPRPPALPGRAGARRRHRALRPPGRRALRHADRAAGRVAAQRQRQRQRRANGAGSDEPLELASAAHPGRGGPARGAARGRGPDEEPLDWADASPTTRTRSPRQRRGPQRRQALLVRARHRRRQDGRRARLRRGLAHRRRPDPHPPPQPRRPVPRRAARPRLRQAHLARAARRQGPGQRPGHRRDLPVVRPQRGQDLRRLHDRHLRRGAHGAGREDLGRDPRLDRARSSSA